MFMGADVTHPGNGVEHCPSMDAVVATIGDVSAHCLGSARLQYAKQEVSLNLGSFCSGGYS